MRFFEAAVSLLALAGFTSALSLEKYDGPTTGKIIVQLKDGAPKGDLRSQIQAGNGEITDDWTIINALAGRFSPKLLDAILTRPDVELVSEDGIVTTSGTQPDSPWGLQRISDAASLKGSDPTKDTFVYRYPDHSLGEGVDIYVVDTGVRVTHEAFCGRASAGYVAPTYPKNEDGNGHGTHVAGTAAGKPYGLAQNAHIIGVKVMSDEGSGSISDIIGGLQYVQQEAASTKRPSVVNMSLGGTFNQPFNDAVDKLTTSNPPVHVVVAAGNSKAPADLFSPASAKTALTVGASDINDAPAAFTNYGPSVKVFAPGVAINSAWNTSDTDTKRISGTSMASPHVAGLVAYFLAIENIAPDAMIKKVQEYALKDKLSIGFPPALPNLLAQNYKST